jgi:predicted ribonuclease YlaK
MNKDGQRNQKKIFVLDTSVILYDHNAFQNFQEHDVAIPIQVLEELDNKKNGNDTRNFEARSFIRLMDELSHNGLRSMNGYHLMEKPKAALKLLWTLKLPARMPNRFLVPTKQITGS